MPPLQCVSFSLSLSFSPCTFFFFKTGKKNIWELIGFPGLAARTVIDLRRDGFVGGLGMNLTTRQGKEEIFPSAH